MAYANAQEFKGFVSAKLNDIFGEDESTVEAENAEATPEGAQAATSAPAETGNPTEVAAPANAEAAPASGNPTAKPASATQVA